MPNNRIMRSLPPSNASKISVKQGISMMGVHGDVSQGRILPGAKLKGSPKMAGSNKFVGGKKRDGTNSGSRRRFDFVGPYAQNLKK